MQGIADARFNMDIRAWLTVAEAAQHAAVSRDTIYTACERGELRHVRVGGRRSIRLRAEWIDGWLEQGTREARPPVLSFNRP